MTSVPVRCGELFRPEIARKRLYSWSRPSRDDRARGVLRNRTLQHSEHCIAGKATVAFHPSGDWFQGNVVSPTDDAYTVYGRKVVERPGGRFHRPSHFLPTCQEDSDDCGGGSSDTTSSSPSASESRGGESPPTGHGSPDDKISMCDSLDSELIREAMECLELELVAEGLYNVTIIDYETGMNHHLQRVCVTMEGDTLALDSDQLSFASTTSYKGIRADVVITKDIGPGLAEIGMTAFRGEMRMTYTEEPCYPAVRVEDSQWCL